MLVQKICASKELFEMLTKKVNFPLLFIILLQIESNEKQLYESPT